MSYEAFCISPYYMKNDNTTFHLLTSSQTNQKEQFKCDCDEKENEWVCFHGGLGEWEKMPEWKKGGEIFMFIRRGNDFKG